VKRLLDLDTSVRVLFPSILVLSIYFLFTGHNQPGGGFVGGLAAGAAISLRYVARGVPAVRGILPFQPWLVLGTGLLLSVLTAFVPMLTGHAILEHAVWEADLPIIGHVKVTSALPFDVGVYLIVVGLVLMVFEAFGEDPDHEVEWVEPPGAAADHPFDEYEPLPRRAK
jgi:multicomponent Na+:H+ antiporter subunit A